MSLYTEMILRGEQLQVWVAEDAYNDNDPEPGLKAVIYWACSFSWLSLIHILSDLYTN